ncbi:MAG: hypothetical protein A3H98_07230 [Bacteroidetes bacterium RIFCSPLOWO2_02_FULL_36_8]|nr:MAG: hypothetical protein A3H98_07230 [Bacteroidetes bacterium RIFCSPLOWO2_02_FULL_36_8]OFY70886.1 MAG: hypothetical protein A3G23_12255 [Bacteroidetes bacterium RIFCSPLOWO2_12_FULL_37_12]
MFQTLTQFLKSIGIAVSVEQTVRNKMKKKIKKNPLKGTVLKYEDPFGPATDINDWEVIK